MYIQKEKLKNCASIQKQFLSFNIQFSKSKVYIPYSISKESFIDFEKRDKPSKERCSNLLPN